MLAPTDETTSPPASTGSDARRQSITIGLVNNMGDAAIRATERQFASLLQADDVELAIKYFHMPAVPRSDSARAAFLGRYQTVDELWQSPVDGLIVTGAEPRAARLQDEPYWRSLTRLIDWAEDNTISTIWSCLAAHAAVLHIDGLERRPLGGKLFGVFECVKTSEHPIVTGAPASWCVPHSRLNDLNGDELVARNYLPLTTSPIAGVDMFLKQRKSLFVFFQGHLEYDAQTLLREYIRDVGRFITGQQAHYPEIPYGYFDQATEAEFARIRAQAIAKPHSNVLAALGEIPAAKSVMSSWKGSAVNIYTNWLRFLAEQKRMRSRGLTQEAMGLA